MTDRSDELTLETATIPIPIEEEGLDQTHFFADGPRHRRHMEWQQFTRYVTPWRNELGQTPDEARAAGKWGSR